MDVLEYINEARKKVSGSVDQQTDVVVNKGKPTKMDVSKMAGKAADKNMTGGVWAIDEPTDEDALRYSSKADLGHNEKRLYKKMAAKDDFFIQGRAGWGKTSVIKKMAKKFGRSVITVYLDKAQKEDLGGIPIPEKVNGRAVQTMAMPGWAAYMLEHPDKQFLLFFDEMNQADPYVQNALMPIVLEKEVCNIRFDNFIVGAAGNFEDENSAVEALSGPLESRFRPIIIWDSNTEESWREAFKFIHKAWDDIIGKELVDDFEQNANLFENPREIEHKVFRSMKNIKEAGNTDFYDAEDFEEDLLDLLRKDLKKDLPRTDAQAIKVLAEKMLAYVQASESKTDNKKTRSRKDSGLISKEFKDLIIECLKKGYIYIQDEKKKYGVSLENAAEIFCDDDGAEDSINAEQLSRLISQLQKEGVKIKYATNDDFIKDGYLLYEA